MRMFGMMLAAIGALVAAVPRFAAAQPMPGVYQIRCQDPASRQWTVLIDRIRNPETVERPANEGGGRVVRGTGPDGKPVTIPMPADRTCMMSAQ